MISLSEFPTINQYAFLFHSVRVIDINVKNSGQIIIDSQSQTSIHWKIAEYIPPVYTFKKRKLG